MNKFFYLEEQLAPVDVIVAKKRSGFGRILEHYIIYLRNGIFIENLKGNVKIISSLELEELLFTYEPVRIHKFRGNYLDVQSALHRAYQKLGYQYKLLSFNCEHFANWVQYGKDTNKQVSIGFLTFLGLLTLRMIRDGRGKR